MVGADGMVVAGTGILYSLSTCSFFRFRSFLRFSSISAFSLRVITLNIHILSIVVSQIGAAQDKAGADQVVEEEVSNVMPAGMVIR